MFLWALGDSIRRTEDESSNLNDPFKAYPRFPGPDPGLE